MDTYSSLEPQTNDSRGIPHLASRADGAVVAAFASFRGALRRGYGSVLVREFFCGGRSVLANPFEEGVFWTRVFVRLFSFVGVSVCRVRSVL